VIAEHLVSAEELATKAELLATKAELKAEIGEVRTELVAMEGRVRAEIGRGVLSTQRWMLTLFATQWLGTVGIIVTIFLKN
jgi:hypothetical protein